MLHIKTLLLLLTAFLILLLSKSDHFCYSLGQIEAEISDKMTHNHVTISAAQYHMVLLPPMCTPNNPFS